MPVLAGTDETRGEAGEMDPRGVSFRRLRPSDLTLMHRWLDAPHVRRRWYAEGSSYGEIEEHYLPATDGREVTEPYVILHRDEPIGFIRCYPVSAEDDETYADLVDVENSAGVDLFIGDPEYLHRGPGNHAICRLLSDHVFFNPEIAVCVIGPEPKNAAVIRAYEKAGFRFFKTIHIPGNPGRSAL